MRKIYFSITLLTFFTTNVFCVSLTSEIDSIVLYSYRPWTSEGVWTQDMQQIEFICQHNKESNVVFYKKITSPKNIVKIRGYLEPINLQKKFNSGKPGITSIFIFYGAGKPLYTIGVGETDEVEIYSKEMKSYFFYEDKKLIRKLKSHLPLRFRLMMLFF